MMEKKWEWNVFLYDCVRDKGEPRKFNVFDNRSFSKAIEDIFIMSFTYEEFEEKVKSAAMWQFWSRCEYEFILLSWPTGAKETGYKMDVYEQLRMNWDRFMDYIWSLYCLRELDKSERE